MTEVEFGLSTSMVQRDLDRLPLLERYLGSHVEVGFVQADRLDQVLDYVKSIGKSYGFHDPLPWNARWQWPTLTDPDPAERARSLGVIHDTLETVNAHDARYALAHFPSVHFQPVAGWSRGRALEAGHEAAATLARWAEERGVPILLENVGPNPYWDAGAWVEILEAYPALGFCLDVGHLHLETEGNAAADRAFAASLAPFTRQVHLYNATHEAYHAFHHVPAHPEQLPSEGWIDIPEILDTVLAGRPGTVRIVFEHTPQFPADDLYVEEGMAWVRDLVTSTAAGRSPA